MFYTFPVTYTATNSVHLLFLLIYMYYIEYEKCIYVLTNDTSAGLPGLKKTLNFIDCINLFY